MNKTFEAYTNYSSTPSSSIKNHHNQNNNLLIEDFDDNIDNEGKNNYNLNRKEKVKDYFGKSYQEKSNNKVKDKDKNYFKKKININESNEM